MNLFIKGFKKDSAFFNKENIKVVFSGRKEPLKKDVIEAMEYLSESTKNNTKGILNICLNYGGRSEIVDAVNHIIKDNLKEVDEDSDEQQIDPKDVENWGAGLSAIDYNALNSHYKFLKDANPQCDSNAEIFIIDLCYTKMQQLKAVREGRVDDYNKLTDSYRKTFDKAGLKTIRESSADEEFTIGVNVETIEKYTPAEFYKNKQLYKDYDDLGNYLERFLLRPLRNLMHGTKDRDFEFFVKDEGDSNEYDDEE